MTLSRILCKIKEWIPLNIDRYTYQDYFGDKEGTCCLCGRTTHYGYKKRFSGNFTKAMEVSTGNIICEQCIHLVKNSDLLRRTMWLVTENEFKTFKKQEAKEIVLNLPDEPFYLYLTETWQQVGWIKMIHRCNHGKKGLIAVCCDYDEIYFTVEQIQKYFEVIGKLRELKIPKKELEKGVLSMHHLRKLDNPRETQLYLRSVAGNPAWRLAVYLNE